MTFWTKAHLQTLIPAFVFMFIISLILKKFLGSKDEKTRLIPLKIISIILIILEIIKQITSLCEGYNLYYIPLHYCSLFIFFYPAVAFYNGKYINEIRSFTVSISGALFMLMLIYPNIIFNENNINGIFDHFMNFHTVAFHIIASFGFLVIITLKLHQPDIKKDIKNTIIIILIYCIIASVIANTIKVNFNNFLSCNAQPIEDLRVNLINQFGNWFQIIYVNVAIIVNILFTSLAYFFFTGLYKIFNLKCKQK